jgi:hypothetical protein
MAVGLPLKTTYADGDVYSASDVNDTNGTVNLFTSSTLSVAAGKNAAIINGAMDVWQRGTSFAGIASSTYTADRWISVLQGTSISCTATQDTSVPSVNYKYSLKYQQLTTSATSVAQYTARQVIEQTNVLPLLGKSATLSFWYRSNKTGSHGVRILATFNTGGTDQATTFTVNAANTWEYKTVAVTALSGVTAASAAPTSIGALVDIGFRVDAAGFTTIAANDFFQFTGVQLELGSTATTFSRAGGTIQGELAACQRYYYRATAQTTSFYISTGTGFARNTTIAYIPFFTPVTMRAISSLDFSGIRAVRASTDVGYTSGTFAFTGNYTSNIAELSYTHGSAVFTQGEVVYLGNNNANPSYIGLNGEL